MVRGDRAYAGERVLTKLLRLMLAIALACNGALAGSRAQAAQPAHDSPAHAHCRGHMQQQHDHGQPAGKGCCGCYNSCDCKSAHTPAIEAVAPLLADLVPASRPALRRSIDLPPALPERLLRPPAV